MFRKSLGSILVMKRNSFVLILLYGLATLHVLAGLAQDYLAGGDYFHQGDWLINNMSGPVRRGLLGSALISFSDWSGLHLLGMLVFLQFIIVLMLYGGVLLAALDTGISDRLLFLLISPAFLLFWSNDTSGSLRKEMLAYLAFLPLLAQAARSRPGGDWLTLLASVLFGLSLFGHEAGAVLAPFLMLTMLVVTGRLSPPVLVGWLIVIASVAGAAAYTLSFAVVPDHMKICAPLLERGFRPHICEGGILWTSRDMDYVFMRMKPFLEPENLLLFGLAYALSFVPVWLFARGTPRPRPLFGFALFTTFFVAILFVIAHDWGRWMNMHMTGLTLLLLAAVRTGWLPLDRRPLPEMGWLAMLVFSLSWGFETMGGPFSFAHGFFAAIVGNIFKVLGG